MMIDVLETTTDYLNSLQREAPVLRALRKATDELPEAYMQVDEAQARFMAFLASSLQVRNALELGTFTGYNALSMALACSDQFRIITCDISTKWKEIARPHWDASGVGHKIEFRLRSAAQVLDALLENNRHGEFDFIFIDADKKNQDEYYEKSLLLLRQGGILIIDNLLLGGAILRKNLEGQRFSESEVTAVGLLSQKISRDSRVDCSFLALADGVTFARKL